MTMPDTKNKLGTQSGDGVAGVVSTQTTASGRDDRYDPAEIEVRWQQRWAEQPDLYRAEPESSSKPKYYVLEMLPYPSGQLHMGHVRNYAIGDALARYMWMQGYNVLHAPARVDIQQYRGHEARLRSDGPELRLAQRNNHVHAGVLPLEPVVLHPHV